LLSWLLLLRGLLKKLHGFHSFLLQIGNVGDELNRVDDLFVVKQHTGNLTSSVSVHLLNRMVDVVSDLLAALCRVHRHQALHIDLRGHLLVLLLLELRLLSHLGLHLIARHLISGGLVALLTLTLSHVVAVATTASVEPAALAWWSLVAILLVMVAILRSAAILLLAVHSV